MVSRVIFVFSAFVSGHHLLFMIRNYGNHCHSGKLVYIDTQKYGIMVFLEQQIIEIRDSDNFRVLQKIDLKTNFYSRLTISKKSPKLCIFYEHSEIYEILNLTGLK